ncbi:pre-rRNA-processing protein TSR4 [Fistulifera solaris]|uniref:Pre-rRNA-processing protein TSR4 n=1 Tax=Fistulifera solaris TaxID=1519565 RepID=A0A1Z5K7F8_FISSO|nr:pre-rRNA-processing protein TSR4 [Fistulifera solaris]|eukprot:GAX22200.1 pre-rRNA-processing protein TSR4 [Fistulifera solaris]
MSSNHAGSISSTNEDNVSAKDDANWTTTVVLQTLVLFFVTGLAEIGGGWLVWKCIRDHRPWWWGVVGSFILILYGFLPTLQPVVDSFGRIYAVYGGFFIALSLLWGWGLDGDRPDVGDLVGSLVALIGVLLMLFWPFRETETR